MTTIDRVIDGIYEASARPGAWESAIGAVTEFFHAASGVLYVEERDIDRFRLLEPISIVGFGPSAIASYLGYYDALNPFNSCAMQSESGVLTEASLEAQQRGTVCFEETEYYRDWVRPQGIRHVVGQRLRFSEDKILTVNFWRPADAGFYSEEEMGTLERISRHLNRALDIGARLCTAQAEMETVLERIPSAVLTLGRDGRVRQANAAADEMLASGTVLRSDGGRLRATIVQDQAPLDRLIAAALDPRIASSVESARVTLRNRNGGPRASARVVAVSERFDPFAPDRAACVVLMVEGLGKDEGKIEARLRRRFGLTPMQTRVAMQLRQGRSVAEAADALDLSSATVRTHLKALFACTGTNRQTELALLLHGEGER
ncbi:helix-turn-helix transcriptional regulator [Aureimonas psammosilenae]|uniref:helix-turn-helix transcriptional regulator n=1 Tax=Aureimonas psammosilenae TaxID=2495496 RepID=UPI0012609AB0|nr:helix-turn-helix transcriptional regulator [Aureimonas psammosilenae]